MKAIVLLVLLSPALLQAQVTTNLSRVVQDKSPDIQGSYGLHYFEFQNFTDTPWNDGSAVYQPGVTRVLITPIFQSVWGSGYLASELGPITTNQDWVLVYYNGSQQLVSFLDTHWQFKSTPGTYYWNGIYFGFVLGLLAYGGDAVKRLIGGGHEEL